MYGTFISYMEYFAQMCEYNDRIMIQIDILSFTYI